MADEAPAPRLGHSHLLEETDLETERRVDLGRDLHHRVGRARQAFELVRTVRAGVDVSEHLGPVTTGQNAERELRQLVGGRAARAHVIAGSAHVGSVTPSLNPSA